MAFATIPSGPAIDGQFDRGLFGKTVDNLTGTTSSKKDGKPSDKDEPSDKDVPSVLTTEFTTCGGVTITRAHVIWIFNLLCLFVHLIFFIVTALSLNGKDPKLFEWYIFRLQNDWPYNATLVDAETPLRIDVLTWSFFLLSALAHLFAVVVGPWDRFIHIYWRQLDLGFVWWRWVEYSLSASVMVVGIALLVGVRERFTLMLLFVTMGSVQICGGLLTELYALPSKNENGKVDLSRWDGDNGDDRLGKLKSYLKRMIPHFATYPLYIACWATLILTFHQAIEDLDAANNIILSVNASAEILSIPPFVPPIVYGSAVLFSLFTLPQVVFMYISPKHYWASELCYCALSLISKTFLGGLLLSNVLLRPSLADAMES